MKPKRIIYKDPIWIDFILHVSVTIGGDSRRPE